MKKKVIAMLLCAALATQPVSMVYAAEEINFGDTISISRDEGNYKVSIDNVVEVNKFETETEGTGTKIVCIQCTIENIDYKGYDDMLSAYKVGTDAISLLDEDEVSTKFFDISTSSDSTYEYSADIKPGEKKRTSLPYYVPEKDSSLTIQIDSQYSISVNLEHDNGDTIEELTDIDSQLKEKVSSLESEIEELKETNKSLESASTERKEKISSLESENAELKEKVSSLESENEELKTTNKKLKSNNKKLKKENEELKAAQNETVPEETPSAEPETTETTQEPVAEYKDATTIRIVQQALNEAGYNCGTPDGISGGKTSQAITSYQTAKGITVNGLITDELLESMGIVEKVQEAIKAEGAKNEYDPNYSYDQLARNPDTYIGKKIKIRGKVLQAETGDDICYARVAMNSSYDTVIFVTYDKDILGYRLLEDDMITVYGTSFGVYSYEAVSGATITIPWLQASIIEM